MGNEGIASARLRRLMEVSGLLAANTFFPAGPTYWGPEGHSSRIDFLLCNKGDLPMIKTLNTMEHTGRRLQLVSCKEKRDHYPLHMNIELSLEHTDKVKLGSGKWDFDHLAACLQKGQDREAL
eukprot:2417616-Heterocapsa_arctica.AAC.1